MTWQLGWQVAVAWLLAVALAGVIYFVPMTRFVDKLKRPCSCGRRIGPADSRFNGPA